jgi:hypothetical protein
VPLRIQALGDHDDPIPDIALLSSFSARCVAYDGDVVSDPDLLSITALMMVQWFLIPMFGTFFAAFSSICSMVSVVGAHDDGVLDGRADLILPGRQWSARCPPPGCSHRKLGLM